MQNKLPLYLIISVLLLAVLAVVSLYMGVYEFENTSFFDLFKGLIANDGSVSDSDRFVMMELRLPRIIMSVLIGSALAVAGTCLQGMYRNPLATPDLIGITAGASFFASAAIVLGVHIKPYVPEFVHFSMISFMAFVGAFLTMTLVYAVSTINGKTNIVVMLLSGMAITALGFSMTGFIIYLAKDEQLRDLTFWNLGSLAGANWVKIGILGVVIVFSYSILITKGKALNALMLGEKDAAHLGINVEPTKKQIILLSALIVGTSVSFAGTISFAGLIVPYILRIVFKSNYHIVLPLSAVVGSVLLLTADTISRTIAPPSEIPIGILTAFMGAPIFMAILMKSRKSM